MSVLDSSTSIKPLSRPWAVLDVVQGDSGGGLFLQLGLSSLPIISVISYLEIFVLLRRVPFSFLELWLLVLLVSWCSSCWLWPGASPGSLLYGFKVLLLPVVEVMLPTFMLKRQVVKMLPGSCLEFSGNHFNSFVHN